MKLLNEQSNSACVNGIYFPRSSESDTVQAIPGAQNVVTSRPRSTGFGPSAAAASSALAGITGLSTARAYSDLLSQGGEGIASFLNSHELMGLSAVERISHALPQQDIEQVTVIDAASQVASLGALQNVLSQVRRLAEDRRAETMTVLADHLGILPEQDRPSAFTETLATLCQCLPIEQRIKPLVQLTWQIRDLPLSARAMACHQIATTSHAMPKEMRARVLEVVRYHLGILPAEARQKIFLEALEAGAQLPMEELTLALGEHAVQLSVLAPDKRMDAFESIIDAARMLDPEPQVLTLSELAGEICEIPENERGNALEHVMKALAALPAQYIGPALFSVGYQHYELGAAEQARLQKSLDALNCATLEAVHL